MINLHEFFLRDVADKKPMQNISTKYGGLLNILC